MMGVTALAMNTVTATMFSVIMTAEAASWAEMWPSNNLPENTIEDTDTMTPVKTTVKVKDVDKNFFLRGQPKMIEKTKILKRVRKLKDKGEERTKIIYRTRIIGLIDPKSKSKGSDFNYFNLGDNIFEWPNDNGDDEDYSDIMDDKKIKSEEQDNKLGLSDLEAKEKLKNNEMPKNKHSAKKELRNTPITVNSVQYTNKLRENQLKTLETIEESDFKLKPTQAVFKKVHFEDEAGPKTEKPFHFVDSLEIYRNEQIRKQQRNQEAIGQQPKEELSFVRPKPLLQRQNAFYRIPKIITNDGQNYNNNDQQKPVDETKSAQPNNNLPVDETKSAQPNNNQLRTPADPIFLYPVRNAPQNNDKPDQNATNSKINERVLRPDWIGNVLIKKVAEAQAVQAQVAHKQMQQFQQQQQQMQQQQMQQQQMQQQQQQMQQQQQQQMQQQQENTAA